MLRDTVADNFEASFIVKADEPLQRFDLLARYDRKGKTPSGVTRLMINTGFPSCPGCFRFRNPPTTNQRSCISVRSFTKSSAEAPETEQLLFTSRSLKP